MKYGRILFAFATLGLSACAKQNMYSQMDDLSMPVLTTFKKYSNSINISRKEYLTVGVRSVKMLVVCRNGENRTWVEVTAPAHVSSSHIDIVESVTKTVKYDGGLLCTAELDKGVMAYEIRYGDSLYTTAVGEKTEFYGYRADRRPKFLERAKRTAQEGFSAVKETAVDLYDAADDELAHKLEVYSRGQDMTAKGFHAFARAYGETVSKGGLMIPIGPT